MCGPKADVVSKGNSFQHVKLEDTREVRLSRQRNPAAFTLVAKLQRQPKNLQSPIPRPPPWLPEHMCLPFDCVTEAQLIMSATESHLRSRASHPRKHTLLYHSLLWQANQSI